MFLVHASPLHRYWQSWHYYCMIVNHWYVETLVHWRPLHVYSVHSHYMLLHDGDIDTRVDMHWLPMYSCCMDHDLYYGYMAIPGFPLYWTLFMLHGFSAYHCYKCMYGFSILVIWILVHITCIIVPCYRIHVIWLFPVTDMNIPVTGHESYWYAICGIPHLLFPLYCSRYIVPVSRYIVLCYQQSSGPVIMLPISCTVFVLVTLYTWHIRS